jgi:hypothetical protein
MKFDSDYRMLIGGQLDAGSASFDVLNPANEQVIGQAPDATPEDLDTRRSRRARCLPGMVGTANRESAANI